MATSTKIPSLWRLRSGSAAVLLKGLEALDRAAGVRQPATAPVLGQQPWTVELLLEQGFQYELADG